MAEKKQYEQQVMEERYGIPYNWRINKFTRHWRNKKGLWQIVSNLAGSLKGKTVLDAGCGDGWYTAKMAKNAKRVIGIDYSERSIYFAKGIVPNADFLCGSLTKIPLPDESIDVIFSIQVLEHLERSDVAMAVSELSRVLKKGGKIVITVPSINRAMSPAHFQHFSKESIVSILSEKFDVLRVEGQEHRTAFLFVCEKFIDNRIWALPHFGQYFGSYIFPRIWNETTPENGQNIVVCCIKS